jgi:hypothetical protein
MLKMNTRTTSGLLTSKESYQAFRAAFRTLANARKLTPQHMALFALVTGRPLGKAFSPVTNRNKLANGQLPWASACKAMREASNWPDNAAQAVFDAAGLNLDVLKYSTTGKLTFDQLVPILDAEYQARLSQEA